MHDLAQVRAAIYVASWGAGLQSTEFHDLKVFFLYDWLASGKLTATGERSNRRGRHTLGSLPKALDRNFRDEGPFVVNFGFS